MMIDATKVEQAFQDTVVAELRAAGRVVEVEPSSGAILQVAGSRVALRFFDELRTEPLTPFQQAVGMSEKTGNRLVSASVGLRSVGPRLVPGTTLKRVFGQYPAIPTTPARFAAEILAALPKPGPALEVPLPLDELLEIVVDAQRNPISEEDAALLGAALPQSEPASHDRARGPAERHL